MNKLFCKFWRARTALTLASLLLVHGATDICAAATKNNPLDLITNTWDCVIGGSGQQGIAFLTFDKDGGLTGPILLAPKPINSTAGTGRPGSINVGRGGSGSGTNSQTVLFGWTFVDNGQWMLDAKSNIIGFFALEHQEPQVTCTTNFVTIGTNVFESVDCKTNIIGDAISFVAKGTPGKRLTIVSSTPYGTVTYRGVPYAGTNLLGGANIDGGWTGVKKENGQLFNEVFTLTTVTNGIYLMTGAGPGYTYDDGLCLISSQKHIGFAMHESGNLGSSTNQSLRATVGTLNPKTLNANTTGLKDPDLNITFKAAPAP